MRQIHVRFAASVLIASMFIPAMLGTTRSRTGGAVSRVPTTTSVQTTPAPANPQGSPTPGSPTPTAAPTPPAVVPGRGRPASEATVSPGQVLLNGKLYRIETTITKTVFPAPDPNTPPPTPSLRVDIQLTEIAGRNGAFGIGRNEVPRVIISNVTATGTQTWTPTLTRVDVVQPGVPRPLTGVLSFTASATHDWPTDTN